MSERWTIPITRASWYTAARVNVLFKMLEAVVNLAVRFLEWSTRALERGTFRQQLAKNFGVWFLVFAAMMSGGLIVDYHECAHEPAGEIAKFFGRLGLAGALFAGVVSLSIGAARGRGKQRLWCLVAIIPWIAACLVGIMLMPPDDAAIERARIRNEKLPEFQGAGCSGSR